VPDLALWWVVGVPSHGHSAALDIVENLWRKSLLPLGCEAALGILSGNLAGRFCDGCAAEREQAPSPLGAVSDLVLWRVWVCRVTGTQRLLIS
jgi:hypothetical protein